VLKGAERKPVTGVRGALAAPIGQLWAFACIMLRKVVMANEVVLPPERFRSRLPVPRTPLDAAAPREVCDRLDSWKAIAQFLGREVRTVQLWEKSEGLPVHRHFHRSLGSVFGFRSELEAWRTRSRSSADHGENMYTGESSLPAPTLRAPEIITIAVLPFDSRGCTREQQRFNDGMASEVVTALGRLSSGRLAVISRTAVMECFGSTRSLERLGQELNAKYLVEGTAHVKDNRVRLNVSLVCVVDKTTVWSRSYHGNFKAPIELQSRLANQIAHCVFLTLLSFSGLPSGKFSSGGACGAWSAGAFLPRMRSASGEAYILGRHFWRQRSPESLRKALEAFELAVREDPRFALAHSGLADALTLLAFYGMASPAEVIPAARGAALKAVELDPFSAAAHASLGDVLFHFDLDWVRAEREYQEAIQCDPTYALSYHWYSNLLAAKGQHEAARLAIKWAVDIDPAPITIVWAGVTAHTARRYDQAIAQYRWALQFDPDLAWAHMYMAQTLEQMGQLTEALREYETAIRLSGGNTSAMAMKAHLLALSGDQNAALRMVDDLSEKPNQNRVPSYDIAAVFARLREYTEMFNWLYRAYAERDSRLYAFPQDPRFDAARRRSEFKGLIERAGLNLESGTAPSAPGKSGG
jgi:TolB-like protein/tetratricopeptide (TPR) repeat protein